MNRKLLISIILLIFIMSSACLVIDAANFIGKISDPTRYGVDPDTLEDAIIPEDDSSKADESKESEDDQLQGEIYNSIARSFNNLSFESADKSQDIIIPDIKQLTRAKVVFKEEKQGDNTFTLSGVTPGGDDPSADIIGTGYFRLELPADGSAPPMDARMPCSMKGSSIEPSIQVLCAGEEDTEEIFSWHIFLMTMQEPIPLADDIRNRVLSIVMDSDRQPENDFVPADEGDFYRYTDLWYEMAYTQEQGWTFQVFRSDGTQIDSQARALFLDNTVITAIPSDEIPAVNPAVRWATWSHLGMYLPENFYGNESSGLEDNNLTSVDPGSVIHITEGIQGDQHWLGNYELCQRGGCKAIFDPDSIKNINQETRCECDGCTNTPSCECALFIRDIKVTPRSTGGSGLLIWKYAAGQGENYISSDLVLRNCFCVKESE